MSRNFSSFADLCMLTSGGQPWALDMQRRSGNPAMFAYIVNGVTQLIHGRSVFPEQFRRARDGVVIAEAQSNIELASPAMVYLAIKFAKSRLLEGGQWRADMQSVIEAACPEIRYAEEGEVIMHDAAGHWASALSTGEWIPALTPDVGPSLEIAQ